MSKKRFTDEQIIEMHKEHCAGLSLRQIGKKYGYNRTSLWERFVKLNLPIRDLLHAQILHTDQQTEENKELLYSMWVWSQKNSYRVRDIQKQFSSNMSTYVIINGFKKYKQEFKDRINGITQKDKMQMYKLHREQKKSFKEIAALYHLNESEVRQYYYKINYILCPPL